MIQRLCEPEHLVIIIAVLLVALLVVAGGKGLASVIVPLFKKLFGGGGAEINLNLGGEMPKNPAGPVCLVDPTKCPDHKAEHERSVKNQDNIEKIFTSISALKKEVSDGNERILLALVAGGHIKPEHIPPKK